MQRTLRNIPKDGRIQQKLLEQTSNISGSQIVGSLPNILVRLKQSVICIRGVPISNFGGITENINFRAFAWFFLVSGRIVPWNKLSSHFLTSTSSHHCPDIYLIFLSVDRLSNWQCLDQGLTNCEAFMKFSQYSRRKLRHKSLRFREQMFCSNPSPQYKTYFTMLSAFKFHSRGGQLGEHREP